MLILEYYKAVFLSGHDCCNWLMAIITGHRGIRRCSSVSPGFQTQDSLLSLYGIKHGFPWQLELPIR